VRPSRYGLATGDAATWFIAAWTKREESDGIARSRHGAAAAHPLRVRDVAAQCSRASDEARIDRVIDAGLVLRTTISLPRQRAPRTLS
jgi:hypothetical protein